VRVLIGQPLHEDKTEQLENELKANKCIDFVLFPEGYLANEKALVSAREIAKKYKVSIATSYKLDNKNRALIINNLGEIVLERAKTLPDENIKLYGPTSVNIDGCEIAYLLCMEILKGRRDLGIVKEHMDLIVHPIGVGMFSDEQFDLWIGEAKSIAKKYNTPIIGASHADGSYKNCVISLPISYFIDSNGEAIYISKSDTRTRIVDLTSKEVVAKVINDGI
jgi:hypothetical protein